MDTPGQRWRSWYNILKSKLSKLLASGDVRGRDTVVIDFEQPNGL